MTNKENKLPNAVKAGDVAFHYFTVGDTAAKKSALLESSKALGDFKAVKVNAHNYRSFVDIDTNINVKNEFGRKNYEFFRPGEAIPSKQKENIKLCMAAYEKIGIIKNVIDLMGDFACQGIKVVHPNAKTQRFLRRWFEKVNGKDRSERFLNLLYRGGNVIVRRTMGKIKESDAKRLSKVKGEAKPIELDGVIKIIKNEIPWIYTFLDPTSIETLGGELAAFVGKPIYAMQISQTLRRQVNNPKNEAERRLVSEIPSEFLPYLKEGKDKFLPLSPQEISVFYYKKDDWQTWANPMTYAILDDLILLEKYKMADLAALDGVISNIRLWKLGDIANGIAPSKAAAVHLSNILTNNVGGGTMDLIWGQGIELVESTTQAFQFLGETKYIPTLNSIYAGLGIPPTLTGAASSSGFTNNFISLKTLIERLQYGRDVLRRFWLQELNIVCRARGLDVNADIIFDRMTLSDEAAEKALLIQLIDRDIISAETVQERFGEIPELENRRMRMENKKREKNKLPQKAGAFHSPQQMFDFKKIALQAGIVTPSEVGMETKPKKSGEKSALQQQMEMQAKKTDAKTTRTKIKSRSKPKGVSGQGRPTNKKDSKKRKQKRVLPRSKASLDPRFQMWAFNTQKTIAELVNPIIQEKYKKKNLRSMTDAEINDMENTKFAILCATQPFDKINAEKVYSILHTSPKVPVEIYKEYASQAEDSPNIETTRQLQLMYYSKLVEGQDG